ncbi:MAG TPA: ATP-binding protein [Sediminibacterium sp.]|nr:ATP-binding protein [Sediminibacterium sp.]
MSANKIKLLEAQLEMEMAARFSAERLLQEKEKEIAQLKKDKNATGRNSDLFSKSTITDTITDYLQTGILIENESGLVVAANQAFCNYFDIRRSPESLVGLDLVHSELIRPDIFRNHYLFLQSTNEILNQRRIERNDVVEMKNGIVLERDYVPLIKDDEYKGHIWYFQNTTDKNLLEKKVEKQKQLYESILSKMPADIAVFNPEHADLFLNPIAIKDAELRQWVIDWMIGKHQEAPGVIRQWEEARSYHELFNQIIQKKEHGSIEETRINENGEKEYFLRNLYPVLDESGEITMVIGYNTNITDRVKAEQELKEAKKMTEEASRAKEIFLANMSHEIRTPMNGILGLINLLEKTTLTSQQSKLVKLINDSSSNLLVIVNDILNIEKIASGKLELEEVPFQLCEKIAVTIESFLYKAEEKGIKLQFMNQGDPEAVAIGDPYRLSQVLNNLIGNAIKFTEKGSVVVTLHPIEEKENRLWITVSVEDSGIGIAPEKLEEIFSPFKQAASAITRRFGGTGLGLSICKNLIELQGGKITVESTPDKGSVFSFMLPYQKGDLSMLQSEQKIITDFSMLTGRKILLAEDLELNQFIVESILKEKGCAVVSVADGAEAVRQAGQHDYDLILMDISMPVMDGLEATKCIRAGSDPEKAAIPIIALTANALKGDEALFREAGMNGYISKPFKELVLLNTMMSALNGAEFAHATVSLQQEVPATPTVTPATHTYTRQKMYDEKLVSEMGKGKIEFIHKMVQLFLKTMPADIEQLYQSAREKDWPMVGKTAHRMKSAIDGMGIGTLKQPIRNLETNAKQENDVAIIPEQVKEIGDYMQRVMEQLLQDYPADLNFPNK